MAAQQELQSGFTLVELAIVLLILGGILTLGLGAINAQITTHAYRTTKAKEETIKDALLAYLGKYRRLPCPDQDFTSPDGDGDDNREPPQSGYCNNGRFGILPYRNLELSRDIALDGWGNFFSYHVSQDSPDRYNWTLTEKFRTGNEGAIEVRVKDAAGKIIQEPRLAAVIVSHGMNGLGAYTVKGTRNIPPPSSTDEYKMLMVTIRTFRGSLRRPQAAAARSMMWCWPSRPPI